MWSAGPLPAWAVEQILLGELVDSCHALILPAPSAGLDLLTQDRLTWVPVFKACSVGAQHVPGFFQDGMVPT